MSINMLCLLLSHSPEVGRAVKEVSELGLIPCQGEAAMAASHGHLPLGLSVH